MKEWISVLDKLPESNKWVYVKTNNEEFKAELNESMTMGGFGISNGVSWYDEGGDWVPDGLITHWKY